MAREARGRARALAAALVLAALGVAVGVVLSGPEEAPPAAVARETIVRAASRGAPAPRRAAPMRVEVQDPAEREATFASRMSSLLESHRGLDDEERLAQVAEIEDDITFLEARGRLLPAQALAVRAVLARLTAESDEAYERELRAMVEAAAAASAELRREADEANIAAAAEYRTREVEVIREVMSSPEFGDEASRSAALRERLQGLRSELRDAGRY